MAVSGAAGGVNAVVYNAVPFTTRAFDMYPRAHQFPPDLVVPPISKLVLLVPKKPEYDIVPARTPLINPRIVDPCLATVT
jgi:hypothetical protein